MTTIREAQDLNVITLDEICESLLTHELKLKEKEEKDKWEAKERTKSIALKASTLEEELDNLSCDDDEELTMVARRFRKLMGQRDMRLAKKGYRRDQSSSWKIRNKNESNKKENIICYECKKLGHFRSECPLLKEETPKKNRKIKKAMVVATWSDNDVSSSDVEEEKVEERANLCLMARNKEFEVYSTPCDISIDEIQEEYECLYDEFEKLTSKYKALKRKTTSLENDFENIRHEFNSIFEQRNFFKLN